MQCDSIIVCLEGKGSGIGGRVQVLHCPAEAHRVRGACSAKMPKITALFQTSKLGVMRGIGAAGSSCRERRMWGSEVLERKSKGLSEVSSGSGKMVLRSRTQALHVRRGVILPSSNL